MEIGATVVIVNYNYDRYVGAAIASALNQSYKDVEVIVVDDGSTDESRRVIEGFGSVLRPVFQPNMGQGAAYNAGWAAARGKFILFLDSDDVLLPNAIEKVAAAFEQSVCVKGTILFAASRRRSDLTLGYLLPSYGFSRMTAREQISNYGYYVSPPASGNAFRKSFLDEIMPIVDEALYRRAADGYTTGLAGIGGSIVSISEPLGLYRIHGANGGGEAGVKSVAQLHHMFMRDIKREDSQHTFGDRFDFHFPADRSRFCPGHTKLRLLSCRLFPEDHPVKTDDAWNLMMAGVRSAVTFPHLNFRKRIGVAAGFIVLSATPRFLLRHFFKNITAPQKRRKAS